MTAPRSFACPRARIILRVRHLDDGDLVEVDTPNLAFDLQRTGEYRIDVDSDGDVTNVSVWSGRGEVTGGGYSYTVVAGQSARFSGTDQLNYDIAQMPRVGRFRQLGISARPSRRRRRIRQLCFAGDDRLRRPG